MTNLQSPASPPDPAAGWAKLGLPNPADSPLPAKAPKTRRNALLIAGVALVGVCLCLGVCGIVVWRSMTTVVNETPEVERVIDEFMTSMEAKDAAAAYALFSTRAQRTVTLADGEKMLEGNNYVLFEGYRSVAVAQINISAKVNTNPDAPQGAVAEVAGNVTYTDDTTGTFTAVLEKEEGEWRLSGINVTVPPDKFGP